jgi:LytS/YehU family sensor histidine kinase
MWALVRPRLWRALLFMTVLCGGIGLLLTVMDGGRALVAKLIYSYFIGFSCWVLIDGARLALSWWLEVRRRARGLPPSPDPLSIRWALLLPLIVVGIALGPLIGSTAGDLIVGPALPMMWTTMTISFIVTVLATAVSVLVVSLQERAASARAQAEAAQRAQAESQLRLLQSQLEPHMLFNTLANLRVLIGLDPARAQEMLDRLIAFLRATLQASRRDAHPLSDEFERVGDYLALMQVRMGPRLQVQLELPAALRDCPVPPLLLQPLVENSIRHGLEPKVGTGTLAVRAEAQGAELHLIVLDTGIGLAGSGATAGTGFGLEQVRQRLQTLYGSGARLELAARTDGPGTQALIALPLGTGVPPAPSPTPQDPR